MRSGSALQQELKGENIPKSDIFLLGDIPPSLRDSLQINNKGVNFAWESRLIGSSLFTDRDVGHVAFVITGNAVTAHEVQVFEAHNNLRDKCCLILLVQIQSLLNSPLNYSQLPKNYHLLEFNVRSRMTSGFSQRLFHQDFNRAHLAIMSSLFGDGLICVDPIDTSYLWSDADQISYQYVRAVDIEHCRGLLGNLVNALPLNSYNCFVCSDLVGFSSLDFFSETIDEFQVAAQLENIMLSLPTNIQAHPGIGLHLFFGQKIEALNKQ